MRFSALDPDDLVGSFERMATEVDAVVHRVTAADVSQTVVDIARDHGSTTVVRTPEAELDEPADALVDAELAVGSYTPALGATPTWG